MVKKADRNEEPLQAVEEALSKTERFIEDNQKVLMIVVSVIVVIVLGFFGYKKFILGPMEEDANSQIFMAEFYFEQDSLDLALYGDGNYLGFLDIIDEFGLTKAGNLSHYYAGICFLNKGEFEDAIHHLKKFKSSDYIVGPMATASIGDAYMELGETKRAIKYYMDAASDNDNEFSTPAFLMKAAWGYESIAEYSKALQIYERIKKDFNRSLEGREIDKYIMRAKTKAENS